MSDLRFRRDDGGRTAAGFRGEAGDCVTRAIAIATETPYAQVYRELADLMGQRRPGSARSARNGIARQVYQPYLEARGWRWQPTMSIGAGTRVHLRADELPPGRLIVRLSKHMCAVIDGVVHDTHDPARGGTRAVYGLFHRV